MNRAALTKFVLVGLIGDVHKGIGTGHLFKVECVSVRVCCVQVCMIVCVCVCVCVAMLAPVGYGFRAHTVMRKLLSLVPRFCMYSTYSSQRE
jgi:hypothetical protein